MMTLKRKRDDDDDDDDDRENIKKGNKPMNWGTRLVGLILHTSSVFPVHTAKDK